MNIRTANKHRKKARFIAACTKKHLWANTGAFLYNNLFIRKAKCARYDKQGKMLTAFRWT